MQGVITLPQSAPMVLKKLWKKWKGSDVVPTGRVGETCGRFCLFAVSYKKFGMESMSANNGDLLLAGKNAKITEVMHECIRLPPQ
jgi:hypothetical protein